MKTFKEFIEGRNLRHSAMRKEQFPQGSLFHQVNRNQWNNTIDSKNDQVGEKIIKNIEGWQVWFINAQGVSEDQYHNLINTDSEMIKKIIVSLMSVGVRKHNRVPIILSYEINHNDAGSYKSSDDYLKIYRNPYQEVETLVGTVAHEIGHAIYNKLPEKEYEVIKSHANSIGSYTSYTNPNFSDSEGHVTGNEWFADYIAAIVMQGYGLPATTKVGSWEPITEPKHGIKAVMRSLGAQEPGRNINKSAARFRQKNLWMFSQVRDLLQKIGNQYIPINSLNLPPRITEKLGNATVKDILDEFLNVLNNRLESLDNADRHLFLKTIRTLPNG